MTPEQAAARITAAIERNSIKPLSDEARDEVLAWATGTTPSGAELKSLLSSKEGEIHLGLLERLVRDRCGPLINGAVHVHDCDQVERRHIKALRVVLETGTYLCNGAIP